MGRGGTPSTREALRTRRHLALRLPSLHRAAPVRALPHLRDDDLRALIAYHEQQAEMARSELASRLSG